MKTKSVVVAHPGQVRPVVNGLLRALKTFGGHLKQAGSYGKYALEKGAKNRKVHLKAAGHHVGKAASSGVGTTAIAGGLVGGGAGTIALSKKKKRDY